MPYPQFIVWYLLFLNHRSANAQPPRVSKFDKTYIGLTVAEVDELCSWILEMREEQGVFQPSDIETNGQLRNHQSHLDNETATTPQSVRDKPGKRGGKYAREPKGRQVCIFHFNVQQV